MKEIGDLTRSIVDRAKSYGADTVPLSNPATLKAPCPKCGGKIVENYRRFACTSCDYSIPKHPGGRTFAPEEVDELLTKGQIGPLEGFISKMGRPFSAVLKLGRRRTTRLTLTSERSRRERPSISKNFAKPNP